MHIGNNSVEDFCITLDYINNKILCLSLLDLKIFIKSNLRFIVNQVLNQDLLSTQKLQKKLFNLSDRINQEFKNDENAHRLAFQIQGIAQGIFSKEEDKIGYTQILPLDIQKKILSEFEPPSFSPIFSYRTEWHDIRWVSKQQKFAVEEIRNDWINKTHMELYNLGYRSTAQAVNYVIKNKLSSVNLRTVRLSHNDLKNIVTSCPNLQYLKVEGSLLTNDSLKLLKTIRLATLIICGVFTGEEFENLNEMKSLRKIEFGYSLRLTDETLEHFKDLHALTSINMSWSKITGSGFKYFEKMSLEEVICNQCDLLKEEAIIHLKKMPLKTLDLSYCNVNDQWLQHLQGIKTLEEVNFEGCPRITDVGIQHLHGMQLKTVYLSQSNITNYALEIFKSMPLTYIRILRVPLITEEAIENFKNHYKCKGLFPSIDYFN